MSVLPKHVIVVGGGIAGLATAYFLQERAADAGLPLACTLIEAERYWGGKILTRRASDLLIEAGPDSFLSQKPWALELCGKLRLADRLLNTNEADRRTFVYSRGRLRELPEGLVVIAPAQLRRFLASGLLSLPGLARMALDLALPANPPPGDESLASFFARRWGREACERLVEPLMAGIYAGDAEQMSLRATFPRFLELEQRHGSVLRGMLAARKRGATPGRGDAPRRTMFVTLRGGLGELAETLVARLKGYGAALRLGERVTDLRASGAPPASRYDVGLASGGRVPGDAVVLATPAYVTADLIRSLSEPAAEELEGIPYASTATVSLAFDRPAVPSVVRGFGFVVPRVEGRSLLAATWTSKKWAHRAPASQVLVRCYLGGVGRDAVLELDDEALVALVREELRQLAGLDAPPRHAEAHRWRRGMPQYLVGHLDRLGRIDAALRGRRGVYLTGAAYRGIGIPDCVKDGAETAGRVIDAFTRGG